MAQTDIWQPKSLEERLDRMESVHAIQQLAYRYAHALDTRNMDDLVALFVEDVRVGKEEGRAALKDWFIDAMKVYKTSVHLVGNHIIEFEGADHARGIVYCRDELERLEEGDWGVGYVQYWDDYVRRDGTWLFLRRKFHRWYMVDALERPAHGAGVTDTALQTGLVPDVYPSWHHFWTELVPKR